MPSPALFLLTATLLPLGAFVLLLCIGKRLGDPLAGWVSAVFIAVSFALSLAALITWFGTEPGHFQGTEWGKGYGPINIPIRWIAVGRAVGGVSQDHPGYLDLGIYVDSLTIAMFAMITLVSTVVHVSGIGYMRGDPGFARFFTYLGLFSFSMLALAIGGTLLHLLVCWELVGLCSYLFIGFWYKRRSATRAALKAFVVNRIGDVGFLIGLGILFYHLGNATLPNMWTYLGGAATGHSVTLPGGVVFSSGLLTAMGICLFFGAIGKSAQFPLQIWLPEAMEAPSPISALIHAATMVAAGVYLVARIYPVLTPRARLFIAIIGVITLTLATLCALAQSDIKRVLAYSTVSQLGFMMLALGIGSWTGGLFHLFTHAFYKSLLFIAAGAVIQAARQERRLSQYGGLIAKMPVTGVIFAIAALTIAGLPGFSAYYSKSMILDHAGAYAALTKATGRSGAYGLFFALPAAMSYVTAFYITRCWMLIFWGRPRNVPLYGRAREDPLVWAPMCVLAFLSMISGKFLNVQPLLDSTVRETQIICRDIAARDGLPAAQESAVPLQDIWPTDQDEATDQVVDAMTRGEAMEKKWSGWAWAIGMGLAVLIYLPGYAIVRPVVSLPPLKWIHAWLLGGMYFDELYSAVLVGSMIGIARAVDFVDRRLLDGLIDFFAAMIRRWASAADWSDRNIIDGAAHGIAGLAQGLGTAVRVPQSGRVRLYVTVLFLAVVLALAAVVVAALSH